MNYYKQPLCRRNVYISNVTADGTTQPPLSTTQHHSALKKIICLFFLHIVINSRGLKNSAKTLSNSYSDAHKAVLLTVSVNNSFHVWRVDCNAVFQTLNVVVTAERTAECVFKIIIFLSASHCILFGTITLGLSALFCSCQSYRLSNKYLGVSHFLYLQGYFFYFPEFISHVHLLRK